MCSIWANTGAFRQCADYRDLLVEVYYVCHIRISYAYYCTPIIIACQLLISVVIRRYTKSLLLLRLTMANEFQVQLKIERAKQHISDLQARINQFFATEPYKIAIKIDSESRKPVYYLGEVDPAPDSLALIAGDAIHSLVCALDHLAYQLVMKDTAGSPLNASGIYFPIGETIAKYESKKTAQIAGARKVTIDAIDALKPYKGGNDRFWQLSRLNNIDKHRLLLTVGSLTTGMDFGQHAVNIFPDFFPPEVNEIIKSAGWVLPVPNTGFPLEKGFVLLIGAVDEKPNPKQQFAFDIGLSEPTVVSSKSLLALLREFATTVDNAFLQLAPLLK